MVKYLDLIGGIHKTLYVNFKYFRLKDAIKLPVWIAKNTIFNSIKGNIIISGPVKRGMVKIGFGYVGIFDKKRSKTILEINGEVHFKGPALIGHGSKICVGSGGKLEIGSNFEITAESSIVCMNEVTFGERCLLSWDILILDSDFHNIKDTSGNIVNKSKPIIIGNHTWIGCRCTITKGSQIGDNNIIAANSCIHGKVEGNNQVIGDQPLRIIKKNVNWD